MKAIDLEGFDARFAGDDDPWRTFSDRDEAVKRQAILRALGIRRHGRVLELAGGNGSNSRALATHALRLDATEGTRAAYDAIVVAELLYYLSPRAMRTVAWDVARALPEGGRLVLAHHRIDFHDFAQHAAPIHVRFLHAIGREATVRVVRRTARWVVLSVTFGARRQSASDQQVRQPVETMGAARVRHADRGGIAVQRRDRAPIRGCPTKSPSATARRHGRRAVYAGSTFRIPSGSTTDSQGFVL